MFAAAHARSTQAFERLRRWQPLRQPCGPPAAHQRRHQAQARIRQRGHGAPVQGGCHTGKVAATQVAAQHAQRQCSQGRAQRDARHAARQPQRARFQKHQLQALFAGQPQHAQQRKLLRPLGHAKRQHREHEEGPGEQRHQRQYREVDAVGARQVANTRRSIPRCARSHSHRPARRALQGGHKRVAAHTRLELDIDAREQALLAKQVLQSANVHHRQGRAAGVDRACHGDIDQLQAGLQAQRLATRRGLQGACAGIQKHIAGRKQCKPVRRCGRHRHQRRCHKPDRQRINADHPQGRTLAIASHRIGADFQHR